MGLTIFGNMTIPNGWRLIYSVANGEIKILSIILEWMSHKDYERRFGY